jgi:hypothetical protein
MRAWTSRELETIDAADELDIRSRRRDGTLRRPVTVWVARTGDDLYIRSINGRSAGWFRGALARHQGRIRAGGVEKDVTFVDADSRLTDEIDRAYRAKYRRYPANIVNTVLTPRARAAALRLVLRERAREPRMERKGK